ncbi:MAG: diadenylate cyclase [Kiritimatiellae bacterium]|nr:diadenylate cyclase [Kiritimatiellia bacterium]
MDWAGIAEAIPDVIQIFILYLVIYAILKGARGSRFGQVLMGTGILFALLIAFTLVFHFDVLSVIVRWLLLYLALSSVVIFQDEIRRMLATMGSLLFQDRTREHAVMHGRITPEDITAIVFKLARRRTGALIAFERGISLRGFETTGVALDAIISSELFFSIFTEPMPLHDGGVVIRYGRVAAAHCLFPVSSQSDLSASGMRHRAAVGLSEQTDALVVVVSEETGRVSVAHNGRLIRYPDAEENSRIAVLRWIRKAMPQQKTTSEAFADWLKRRREKAAKLFRRRKENA